MHVGWWRNIKTILKSSSGTLHLKNIFILSAGFNVTFLGCSHDTHCWPLTPLSSFPGRPIPPTSSSSLLPSAQLPSSHNPPPVSCQMPLLDSNTSHQIMDTNPDEEFSPNSYLLRACSGPQQASSSGKETLWCLNVWCFVVDIRESPAKTTATETKAGRRWCGEHQGETHLSIVWHGSSKMHLLKVTAVGEVLLIETGSGPPSMGGICLWLHVRACWAQRWSVGRHQNIEFCITMILVIAKWPWTPSHALFMCVSVPFLFITGFCLPLPCLFYTVLRLKCIPLTWILNAVCQDWSVWGTTSLWPAACATSLEFNERIARCCDKHSFWIHSSCLGFHSRRTEGMNTRFCSTFEIVCLNSHSLSLR